VRAAVKAAVDGRLRLYPNPTAERLREQLAKLHGCRPENIIAGNGSDELLALATRAFVEPTLKGGVLRPPNFIRKSPSLHRRPILHAELLAVSGAGGHPWRGEKRPAGQSGFQPAVPARIETRQGLEF